MQKKLLTLAVAGALGAPGMALAQANVEVYGTLSVSFGNVKYSGATSGAPSVSKWDVASHGSNFGLRGRENLGGGLTGWFQVENGLAMERSNDNSNMIGSRNTAVGMQGGFGNLFMGQWTTPWADLDSLWAVGSVGSGTWGPVTSIIGRRETTGVAPNPNCANIGQGVGSPAALAAGGCNAVEAGGGVGHPFWRRVSNAVFYQSSVMGGAQIKLAYQTNEGKSMSFGAATQANASMWSASGQWAGMGGAARIGAAIDRHKDFSVVGKTDSGYALKGGWNFGVADIGLAYENMKYNQATSGEAKTSNYAVGLAVPIGSNFIRGTYAVAKDVKNTVVSGSAQTGAKEYNIGYEHRFSKRTQLSVGYAKISNEAGATFIWSGLPPDGTGVNNTGVAGQDVATFFVNMTTRF